MVLLDSEGLLTKPAVGEAPADVRVSLLVQPPGTQDLNPIDCSGLTFSATAEASVGTAMCR